MNDRPYGPATGLLVLAGVLAAAAGFWLAITSQWSGAAGAALVIILAAGGLVAIGDRSRQTPQDRTVPPTSVGPDPENEPPTLRRPPRA